MGRFLRPGWVALYALLLLSLTWWVAPKLLRRIDFFRVRRVEIVGLQYLGRDEVLRGLGLPKRVSVFDDKAPWERRARAIPGSPRPRSRGGSPARSA
jgi:hypothetical protein